MGPPDRRLVGLRGMAVSVGIAAAMWACVASATPTATDPLEPAKAAIRLKDYGAAATKLTSLAQSGNADAQYLLGTLYLAGLGTAAPDVERARQLFEQSAGKGSGRAALALSAIAAAREPPDAATARILAGASRIGGRPAGAGPAEKERAAARVSAAGRIQGRSFPAHGVPGRRRSQRCACARSPCGRVSRRGDGRVRPHRAASRRRTRRCGCSDVSLVPRCESRHGRPLRRDAPHAGGRVGFAASVRCAAAGEGTGRGRRSRGQHGPLLCSPRRAGRADSAAPGCRRRRARAEFRRMDGDRLRVAIRRAGGCGLAARERRRRRATRDEFVGVGRRRCRAPGGWHPRCLRGLARRGRRRKPERSGDAEGRAGARGRSERRDGRRRDGAARRGPVRGRPRTRGCCSTRAPTRRAAARSRPRHSSPRSAAASLPRCRHCSSTRPT